MNRSLSAFSFLIIIIAVACNTTEQKKDTEALYKSAALTADSSFTNGAEGPAVDKDGNLYAVNFAKEGTIGKISPEGEAALFMELPNGSIGNGIRFSSKLRLIVKTVYTQAIPTGKRAQAVYGA